MSPKGNIFLLPYAFFPTSFAKKKVLFLVEGRRQLTKLKLFLQALLSMRQAGFYAGSAQYCLLKLFLE